MTIEFTYKKFDYYSKIEDNKRIFRKVIVDNDNAEYYLYVIDRAEFMQALNDNRYYNFAHSYGSYGLNKSGCKPKSFIERYDKEFAEQVAANKAAVEAERLLDIHIDNIRKNLNLPKNITLNKYDNTTFELVGVSPKGKKFYDKFKIDSPDYVLNHYVNDMVKTIEKRG